MPRTRGGHAGTAGGPLDKFRRLNLTMLVLLLVQFGFGIGTNLYVKIPSQHPGAQASNYFTGLMKGIGWVIPNGAIVLAAHAALGLALILVGLAVLVRSFSAHRGGILAASLIGWLAIIGAGFNGASFLNYNNDISSLIMSLLFALAVLCYGVTLYLLAAGTVSAK
ncbi:MAG: hypothetical protein ACRDX8_13610 [Acidimicrobiales bacterium]